MSRDKKDLHSELVTAYEAACIKFKELYPNDPQPFLTYTYRSDEEQTRLYAQGRTVKGAIVTNAKAGESPHNFNPSFAFDIAFVTMGRKLSWDKKLFKKFADIVKEIAPSIEWGGDWKFLDVPHFQLKAWNEFKNVKHL